MSTNSGEVPEPLICFFGFDSRGDAETRRRGGFLDAGSKTLIVIFQFLIPEIGMADSLPVRHRTQTGNVRHFEVMGEGEEERCQRKVFREKFENRQGPLKIHAAL